MPPVVDISLAEKTGDASRVKWGTGSILHFQKQGHLPNRCDGFFLLCFPQLSLRKDRWSHTFLNLANNIEDGKATTRKSRRSVPQVATAQELPREDDDWKVRHAPYLKTLYDVAALVSSLAYVTVRIEYARMQRNLDDRSVCFEEASAVHFYLSPDANGVLQASCNGGFSSSSSWPATLPPEVAALSFPVAGWVTFLREGPRRYVGVTKVNEREKESGIDVPNLAGK
ncbi:hypothetical protein HPB51_007869 [Rhipicephalus microplus]|uniref:Uncharacterized protein n=1 Tax=Rhipicephalus microplus TaxID=6941 RepID=A0A9J6DU42_RHIMP|nr:hypothetical protein HPB51_007869 [Rhipicephalus microplus]